MDIQGLIDHVNGLLAQHLNPELCYHDLDHTLDVCNAARNLARLENTDERSTQLLIAAALMHDVGMLVRYANHEEASAELARQIMPAFGFLDKEIEQVCDMILITRMPQSPSFHLGSILCDADLDYLGRDDFFIHSLRLRQEWYSLGVMRSTIYEWFRFQVQFMENHHYHTPSAKKLRSEGKQHNLDLLKEILNQKK